MKIAFISDIHANVLALEAVLKDIKKAKADRIVFLGDASTLGIRPADTLDLLASLQCDCVMGNHDEFMLDPERIHKYTDNKLVIDTVEWSRQRHYQRHFDFIGTFKREVRIPLARDTEILCYHGSPVSNMENVTPCSGLDCFSDVLEEKKRRICIGGHTHVQMLRNVRGTRIVTCGSVGQPFAGYEMPPSKHPWAEYTMISDTGRNYDIQFRQVDVDNDKINREILESDSPMNRFISE